jgi:ABC-type transport system involved in multi-copper enzyme maturation permease subunit
MPIRITALIRSEIFKMFHMKLTYFFLACGVAVILFWGISTSYFFPDGSQPGTGYIFLLSSNQTTMSFLGVIFIMIFGSLLISSETASGTLQTNLVNPISRLEFLSAKLIIGWLFSLLLVLSMALPALAIGGLKFGYGHYVEEGLTLFTRQQIFTGIMAGFLVLSVVLLAYVSYSLLISVLTSNPGYAIGLCVGSVLMMDFIRGRLNISPFLFQSYVETPFELAKSMPEGFRAAWQPDITLCLGVPLVWTVVCFAAAVLIFMRKDYKS